LRLSAFCRQALFAVFLGSVSATDHLLRLSPSQRNDETGGAAHGFFLKKFFPNFSVLLPKRMVQTVVVAKGEENRITRLCGREGR
jgi:hypothetical protein